MQFGSNGGRVLSVTNCIKADRAQAAIQRYIVIQSADRSVRNANLRRSKDARDKHPDHPLS